MIQQWVPAALFRCLSDASRAFALRLILAPPNSVAEQDARSWASTPAVADTVLTQLRALRLVAVDRRRQPPTLWVNPHFVSAVQFLVLSDEEPVWAVPEAADPSADPLEEEIERFSRGSWERLLEFIVGGQQQPGAETMALLETAGVLRDGRLTRVGFQFLLKDSRAQVWTLLLAFVRSGSDEFAADAASLILRASFLRPWKPYETGSLSAGQARVLSGLAQLGLAVLQPENGRFFPAKMLSDALGPQSAADSATTAFVKAKGGIIAESNFRVYAYTSSRTVISLVRIFAEPIQRLPGMFVATITRDSVRIALLNGITADQIIEFLRKNAHPSAAVSPNPVPETVADQLRLWENERRRITFEPAVLMSSFASRGTFEVAKQRSQQIGGLLWASDRLQRIVVRHELFDDVRQALATPPPSGEK